VAGSNDTRQRVLALATASFGTRGYEGTSLDQLAAELGVRKQTILYYHPSKSALLDAVIDQAATDLADVLEGAVARAPDGDAVTRVEAIVRSIFRLALRRPELLGLLREVSRPGAPAAARLTATLQPLVERAVGFLEAEMDAGRLRRTDARLLILSVYSTVVGVATEVEVLRAVGVEPTLRTMAGRRAELLRFLRAALVQERS
jgi:TetR/AcrR family transcriptional regulator